MSHFMIVFVFYNNLINLSWIKKKKKKKKKKMSCFEDNGAFNLQSYTTIVNKNPDKRETHENESQCKDTYLLDISAQLRLKSACTSS